MSTRSRMYVETLGGTTQLAARCVTCWFTPPFSWWREAVHEAWILLKRCLVPAFITTFVFGYGALGINAGTLLTLLGLPDRLGSPFSVAALREFVPWVTAMVVAGVAGTAVAADLGARKVREELDAMAVLAVETTRALAAPRVLAITILMPAINVLGLVIAMLAGVAAAKTFHAPLSSFFATFNAGFTTIDLVANLIKTTCFGFLIGVICAYKGLTASGGSEGVGRAVNQAVLAAFVAVWVFNLAFNAVYLATFPGALEIR